MQSDQYHYLHHRFHLCLHQDKKDKVVLRFFECNYGNSRTPFDKMFGTFRDKLAEEGTSYRGGSEEKV